MTPAERCARLDANGRQCRKLGVWRVDYHGDSEIYSAFDEPPVCWVRVWLCDAHGDIIGRKASRARRKRVAPEGRADG